MSNLDGDAQPARADPSIPILLALFTLLLAFFILLNGVAIRESSRVEALMQSLNSTFAGGRGEQPKADDPVALSRDALRTELGALLERTLPDAVSVPDDRNGALRVVVPVARLFREELIEFHSRGAPLTAGLAELMRRPRAGVRLEAEFRVGAAEMRDELALRRTGALARELARLGAPAGRFGVGLQAADPAAVEVAFRLSLAAEDGR